MAGGVVDVVPLDGEQFIAPELVIPGKYVSPADTEAAPTIELMHFDFNAPPAADAPHGAAANEDSIEKAA